MRICSSCGNHNYDSPPMDEEWICESCGAIIRIKVERYEPITEGNKITKPKVVPYDSNDNF